MNFDMPDCGGCRTCKIACSYHHTGGFVPSVSSIKILDKEDGVGYHVLFVEQEGEGGDRVWDWMHPAAWTILADLGPGEIADDLERIGKLGRSQ
jgi:hypothetical protein